MKTKNCIERVDITDEVIAFIELRLKEYVSECDIETLGLYPKRISRAIVKLVHDEALHQHPLSYKHSTSLVTGFTEKTIYNIVHKS